MRLERTRIREVPSSATSSKIPNHKTTTQNDISEQQSKQSKTGEDERNYKMFASPVVINPSRYMEITTDEAVTGDLIWQRGF